jgi:hypothetical protein
MRHSSHSLRPRSLLSVLAWPIVIGASTVTLAGFIGWLLYVVITG